MLCAAANYAEIYGVPCNFAVFIVEFASLCPQSTYMEKGKNVDHSRPNSLFESKLNGLDQDALRRVALAISAMLDYKQDLLPIEEEVRSDLRTFGEDSEWIGDKALLFWRTARIVQIRELAPEAHANGDTLLTRPVWNLLLRSNVRTTPGHSSLTDLAREAERARIKRDTTQRRRIGGRGRGSSHHKADLAGDVVEGATEGLFSKSPSSSSGSHSSSSGGGGFDLDCCPDSLFVLVRATVKYRRFIR
jgi:hypothetical protein